MTNLKAGLAICALLAFVDVAAVAGAGMGDAPPVFVWATGGALGLATFAFLPAAARERRGALWGVVVSRALSAAWGLPVYFADSAPTWAKVATTVAIALSVLGIGLLVPYARRSGHTAVRTA